MWGFENIQKTEYPSLTWPKLGDRVKRCFPEAWGEVVKVPDHITTCSAIYVLYDGEMEPKHTIRYQLVNPEYVLHDWSEADEDS